MQLFSSRTASLRAFSTVLLLLATAAPGLSQEPDAAQLELGKQVFNEVSVPQCAVCHTLADAGSTGTVGPILDQLKPDTDRVKNAVVNGIGPMQPNEILTDEQVDAVAAYVSQASGGAR